MRVFISEFLTTPFTNKNIKSGWVPHLLYEEILNLSNIDDEEIDYLFIFGIRKKEGEKIFKKNINKTFFYGNSTGTLINSFVLANELLKNNKANLIILISINEKPVSSPFKREKIEYLCEAKEFNINRTILDEILIKSYLKYENIFSKENLRKNFQPLYLKDEEPNLIMEDQFFLKGLTRENLNLKELQTSDPWEIFTDYHFCESASGGCALILLNEDFLRKKHQNNLVEVGFFNYTKNSNFPLDLIDLLSFLKDFYYKTAFSFSPCIFEEAKTKAFFSDYNLQKEYLGKTIQVEEINPYGSELFWGWAKGSTFLRRIGFLKTFLEEKKGKGLLIEKIYKGPKFLMELINL